MKKTNLSLAFKIAQLIEDHSKSEIENAVKLLRSRGWNSDLLDLFTSLEQPGSEAAVSSGRSEKKSRNVKSVSIPNEVLILERTNLSHFQNISTFISLIERREVLRNNIEIRRFGEALSKSYVLQKSRADSIQRILIELANASSEKATAAIRDETSKLASGPDEDFRKLANYIMKGDPSKNL